MSTEIYGKIVNASHQQLKMTINELISTSPLSIPPHYGDAEKITTTLINAVQLSRNGHSLFDFRSRIMILITQLPQMGIHHALTAFTAQELAEVSEHELVSADEKCKREAERHRRARETRLRRKDDTTNTMCLGCNLPKKKRLNMNRFGIDDEILWVIP